MPTEVKIFEVTQRQTYELTTGTGGNRPIYIGSREWRELQQARAIANGNVQTGPVSLE